MNNTLDSIFKYIDEYDMIKPSDKIVIGLSGGADSVCLLITLAEYMKYNGFPIENLFAVHVHHMIRGDEADSDMKFANDLCDRLKVKFISYKKDIKAYAKEHNMSVEEAGRTFRYESFFNVCKTYGCTKIAVAHNRCDQAETVIFNLVRGTGLKGISGILPVRDNIIRPLLDTSRQDIEAYLLSIGQNYRTDSTNNTLDYDRNKIRHVIIPALKSINSEAVAHITHAAKEALNSYNYIHEVALCEYSDINNVKSDNVKTEGSETNSDETDECKMVVLNSNELYKLNTVLQEHMIHEAIGNVAGMKKDITRKHVMSVVNLIYSDTGKSVNLPYGIKARKNYGEIIISSGEEDTVKEYEIILSPNGVYELSDRSRLKLSLMPNSDNIDIPKKLYTKMVDYGKIKGAFCVRTPREGDYIVIDNAGKTKKLNRVFIDNKIDRERRDTWPVVACGSEIIWAIGLRYSEAFKIDENTENILQMKYLGEGE